MSLIYKWLGSGAVLCVLLWFAYSTVFDYGYAQSEKKHELARLIAVEEQMENTLDEIERNNQISDVLSKTQRKLYETKSEYITYANAVTGMLDPSFSLLVQHASGAEVGVSEAISPSTDRSSAEEAVELAYQTAMARLTAINIAENYSALDLCIAEKLALNHWHRSKEVVK